MNRPLSIIAAILRKDFLLLWPLVALIAALQLLQITYFELTNMSQDRLGVIAQVHLAVLTVATFILMVSLVQNDSLVGVRHDWLTKPIPRLHLFAAKLAFVLVAFIAPSIVIEAVIFCVRFDASVGEALARASKSMELVALLVGVSAVAALTATVLQTAAVIIGTVIIASLAFAVALKPSGLTESFFDSGAHWLLEQSWILLATALSIVILWLQYARRKTVLARTLFAAGALLIPMAPLLLSWDRVFAIQKSLSHTPAAADAIRLAVAPHCFPSILVNPFPANAAPQDDDGPNARALGPLSQSAWPIEQRRIAGPGAIGFATELMAEGIPSGGKLLFARVQTQYLAGGKVIETSTPLRIRPGWKATAEDRATATHLWLLSRNAYEQINKDATVQTQIDYSLSLLKPLASFEIPGDGSRQYSPEIGYCRAESDKATATVTVNCFKRGSQAALLAAEIVGVPTSHTPISFPNYTPAWLELFRSRTSVGTLRQEADTAAIRVKITAYDDEAHFDRQIVVPGILGGPANACPAPPAA